MIRGRVGVVIGEGVNDVAEGGVSIVTRGGVMFSGYWAESYIFLVRGRVV